MPDDENIYNSAKNILDSVISFDSLMDTIRDFLEREKSNIGFFEDLGDEDDPNASWIASAHAYNARILEKTKMRGRAKQIGTVTIILRLCGPEDHSTPLPSWPWLNKASVIVGWHKFGRAATDQWYIENFNPVENEGFIRNTGGRIWSWYKDDQEYSWFFAAPLFSLKSERDILIHLIKPFAVLFHGGTEQDAFPDDSPVYSVDPS